MAGETTQEGGQMKRPRGTGCIYQQKVRPAHISKEQWKALTPEQRDGQAVLVSANWWIQYYRNGKPYRESTGTTNQRKAQKLLAKRLAEIQNQTFIEPTDRRVTVDELYAALLADYRNNEMASLDGAKQRWETEDEKPGRLQKHFGGLRGTNITTEMLNKYVGICRDEYELSNGTINRDLSALRRAFNLALNAGKLQKVPKFPRLKESAPRSGFVEEKQYNELAKHATELWLRGLLAVAYNFGFRKSELLHLRVNQIDLFGRTIRLNPGQTKNDDGRVVPMTSDV